MVGRQKTENRRQRKDEVVILGAGLAGLSAAYHLKRGYSLFEKEAEPGGMARSIYEGDYIFDYDGHLLYFRNKHIFSLVKNLLDGNLAPHKRNSWIYSKGSYTRYPFQANFYGLPNNVVKDCLLGLIKARMYRGEGQCDSGTNGNFEDWIIKTLGTGVAEHFMLPYNRKFWTMEPSELMCDWLDGFVPVPTIEDVVTGAISSYTRPYGYNTKFWYPIRGGISEIVDGFLQRINNVRLREKAVTIDQYRKEIVFEDGTIKGFSNLVTTIPMPELSRLLVNVPDKIKQAFSMLKFTSIFVVNLGIARDDITDRHWVYYPEDSVVFYRTGFPTNFSMDVAPSKRTSIYAEISYSDKKAIDRRRTVTETIDNLKGLGIIADEKEIEVCLPVDIKYGYVIYDAQRRRAVQLIKHYLKRFGIHSIGRYGSWRYMSMEDVILEGKEIAERLTDSIK